MADSKISHDEMIVYLTRWAADQGCTLDLKGEVGFGRECIGIVKGNQYVDTGLTLQDVLRPDDAYHKQDCLAVLGRDTDQLEQLYDWVRAIDEAGYFVHTRFRRPKDALDAIFSGTETVFLTKDKDAKSPKEVMDEIMAKYGQ